MIITNRLQHRSWLGPKYRDGSRLRSSRHIRRFGEKLYIFERHESPDGSVLILAEDIRGTVKHRIEWSR